MKLSKEQLTVVDDEHAVLVVMGGAGTGKTTTAAALVRRRLAEAKAEGRSERTLFLSFSKSAVAQILERSSALLGPFADHVEVTTFHALAWKIIARWGAAVGVSEPTLLSPSEKKVFGSADGLEFDDLIPTAASIVAIAAIGDHLRRRWSVIVVDEFQDTSDQHWQLILSLRGSARLIMLGDLNQCIYKNLPGSSGVGPSRIAAAMSLPDARRIVLPAVSHRDPTYVLPAAAEAIRRRQFDSVAVGTALELGMLEVRNELDSSKEVDAVIEGVADLRSEGYSVGIFSHHVDSTTALSDHLHDGGVPHEIVGLPDAVDAAIRAQFGLLSYACGEGNPDAVTRSLAVFVASNERGKNAPPLARMIARVESRPPLLDTRLSGMSRALLGCRSLGQALTITADAFDSLGFDRGRSAWIKATAILIDMIGPRALAASCMPPNGLEHLQASLDDHRLSLLTHTSEEVTSLVQVMGLYQSKGREVDASLVVLRERDYFGQESEPMPESSNLLYVVLTRARKKTMILTIGSNLPPLISPLDRLRR